MINNAESKKQRKIMKKLILVLALVLGMQTVVVAQEKKELFESEFGTATSQGYLLCRLRDNQKVVDEYMSTIQVPDRVLKDTQLLIQFQQVRWAARVSCDVTLDEVTKELLENGKIKTY